MLDTLRVSEVSELVKKTTLGTSEDSEKYTRNEWRLIKLHSKRVKIDKTTLKTSEDW